MQNNNKMGFDWFNFNGKAQDFLGEDFWNSINSTIPKRGPNIDIYKNDREIVAVIEAAGISSSDKINIRLKGNKLIVEGTIPMLNEVNETNIIRSERFIGEFKREITLPMEISPNGSIDAQFKNGLIIVHIPLVSTEVEKEVPINFNNTKEGVE